MYSFGIKDIYFYPFLLYNLIGSDNMEIWKSLKYNEKYLISSEGKIKSLYTNKLIKPFIMKKGYAEVSLWINNKRIVRLVCLMPSKYSSNSENFFSLI